MYLKSVLLFLLFFTETASLANISQSTDLLNPIRRILNMDMISNQVCWIDSFYKLKCLDRHFKRETFYPQRVSQFSKIHFSENHNTINPDHAILACAVQNSDLVTKCWNYKRDWMPFVVAGLKSPKKFSISGGLSCAVQSNLATKCWYSNPPLSDQYYGRNGDFLFDFTFPQTKLLKVSGSMACAVNTSDELACWDSDEVIFHIRDKKFKGATQLFHAKGSVCVVDSEGTHCSGLYSSEKHLNFRTYKKLDRIKLYELSGYSKKPTKNGRYKEVKTYLFCGFSDRELSCYNTETGQSAFNYELKQEIKDYSLVFLRDKGVHKVQHVCFYQKDKNTVCEDLITKQDTQYHLDRVAYYQALNDLRSRPGAKYLGNGCVHVGGNDVHCIDQSRSVDKYSFSYKKPFKFKSVYITKKKKTCVLTLEDQALCWSTYYSGLLFRDKIEDETKSILLKRAKANTRSFIANETKNCSVVSKSIVCRRSVDIRENNFIYKFTLKFNEKPYYIVELKEDSVRDNIVCGVNDHEFKCEKIKWILEHGPVEQESVSSYIYIGDNKYDSKIKNKDNFYSTLNHKHQWRNKGLSIRFKIPKEAQTGFDYFSYNEENDNICAHKKNDISQEYCWLMNVETDTINTDFINVLSIELYTSKYLWFYNNYDCKDLRGYAVSCLGLYKLIANLEDGNGFFNHHLDSMLFGLDKILQESESNAPGFYREVLEIIRKSIDYKMKDSNFLLNNNFMTDTYHKKNYIYNLLLQQTRLTLERMDSSVIQETILPNIVKTPLPFTTEFLDSQAYSKLTNKYLLRKLLNLQLDFLGLLSDFIDDKFVQISDYKKSIKSLLQNLESGGDIHFLQIHALDLYEQMDLEGFVEKGSSTEAQLLYELVLYLNESISLL